MAIFIKFSVKCSKRLSFIHIFGKKYCQKLCNLFRCIQYTGIKWRPQITPGNRANLIKPLAVFGLYAACFFWFKVFSGMFSLFEKRIILQKSSSRW